jgi:hypothetical protein
MTRLELVPKIMNLAVGLLARHPEADEVEMVFTVSVKGSTGPAGGHPGNPDDSGG